MSEEYRDDRLYLTHETDLPKLITFVERSISDPYVEGEKIVWNLNGHEFRPECVDLRDLEKDEFVVPFQVPGVWSTMVLMLPERIRSAEKLIWNPRENEYRARKNRYRDLDSEQKEQLKKHFGEIAREYDDR